ncbi:hypothetical protein [Pinisolibacter aquiterrae]|uniref:hypothetical protein n=1 Tax=Pinisolibacter aquiterrae TaxID=2815579 RepID=UPI001C3C618E|nr:hypothetical protein [Pinisolibacter aquiterrae]MBV5264813.1 hypothetical protein [Pinisolibacter aquiterrae]MCC8234232.1 hypothetical protein [Pinisolibacter aquiterrae]
MRPFLVVLLPALVLPLAASAEEPAPMGHVHSMSGHAMHGMPAAAAAPREPGQGAFAAIQEIEEILEADPSTDWSKVDLEALRRHLIDMNRVTLEAEVKNEAIDGGMRFVVTGVGPVADSIRRMVVAHAATMNGVGGWTFEAARTEAGAVLTVRVPPQDLAKLRGLGFIGAMTRGMHHQEHHLTIARGGHPHP